MPCVMDGQVIKHGESKAELETCDPGFTGVNTSKVVVEDCISHLAGSSELMELCSVLLSSEPSKYSLVVHYDHETVNTGEKESLLTPFLPTPKASRLKLQLE